LLSADATRDLINVKPAGDGLKKTSSRGRKNARPRDEGK